jgi:hypothetical protein
MRGGVDAVIDISTAAKADQFERDATNAAMGVTSNLTMSVAVNRCMHDGAHWIMQQFEGGRNGTLGRKYTNWNPNSANLYATANRVPKLIQEVAAATFPDRLEAEVLPPPGNSGIRGSNSARVLERLVNAAIDSTGYVSAARMANFRRCIDGTYGVGLRLKTGRVGVGSAGAMEDDVGLSAFTFDCTRLVTDPYCQELDLDKHEWVIYREVWSAEKIKRELGLDLKPDDLATIGQLCASEMEISKVSGGRLYANLWQYSQTKGAVVSQVHIKDDYGRWSVMLVGVRPMKGESKWVNLENPESPFGFDGLPLTLLHGYPRPESMWSLSDAAMLKDDQDKLNLIQTLFFRILVKHAGYQWLVPQEALPGDDLDNFKSFASNTVGGVVTYKSPTRDRPFNPPQLLKYPDPPPFIQQMAQMYEGEMREQVHRPDITMGATKSHVPDSSYQSAMRAANQVLGNRVRDDVTRHERLLKVALGTIVKLAKAGSPGTLASLARAGFGPADFAVIAETDEKYPACEVRVRDSSIKYESKEDKERRLWAAVQAQVMSAPQVRLAMAQMDTPIDQADKDFADKADEAANRVLAGEEWQPVSLGEYTDMFLTAFRRARLDWRADESAMNRLDAAIQSQLMLVSQEQQMLAPQAQQQTPAPDEQQPSEADLATLVAAIDAAGRPGA